ncbi:GNAT family N-acetyltransferase [Neisseria sp. Ec49-e6-T10]|uniref:GNAT family N-acetyltransferase n=1 Tax=Neisseria sp. Ec49-e6-T10 TaxID=3140744 RepID=UPI003EBF265E
MDIYLISENKKQFLDLLLLADEEEHMIDLYLDRGDLFALYDGSLKSICVVTQEAKNTWEIKNLATYPQYQGLGYATHLIKYILKYYQREGAVMLVGTGDTPKTIGFYQKCGFALSHQVNNFFLDHYTKPIIEEGIQLVDMIYLKKAL